MPISNRYNINGQYVGSATQRAAYFARWAKYARLYAAGVGVGLARVAGVTGAVATAGYYAYKAMATARGKSGTRVIRRPTKRISGRGGRRAGPSTAAAVQGQKRGRSSGGRMRRVRRRFVGGGTKSVTGGEQSYAKSSYGKTARMTLSRLAKMLVTKIYRFQGVNRSNTNAGTYDAASATTTIAPPGYFWLQNTPNGVGTQTFPLHIYDLTTLPVFSTTTSVARELTITDGGGITFASLQGTDAAGSGFTPSYVTEFSSAPVAEPIQQRFINSDWFDIRLNLYGARRQPTFYDIMVVKFVSRACDPIESATGMTSEELEKRKAFYQGMVKAMVYSPILPAGREFMKGITVVKRFRTTIQASNNDEADRNPNNQIYKLYYRDGKMRDYNYSSVSQASDALVNDDAYAVEDGTAATYTNDPKQPARLFLIVRASNTTPTASPSGNDTPSYDLVIRKKCQFDGK